jgi:transposase-like protein
MGRKPKYSKEIKIRTCEDYQNNKDSCESISKLIGTDYSSVRCWYLRYKKMGPVRLNHQIEITHIAKSLNYQW